MFATTKKAPAFNNCVAFHGNYECWADAIRGSKGYEAEQIVKKVHDATLQVLAGVAAYERDGVVFHTADFTWPIIASLLEQSLISESRVRLVDFGGALGSTYFQNRSRLAALKELSWAVVEQPAFVDVGNAKISNDQLRFYRNLTDAVDATNPNVLMLCSVLQYLPNPREALVDLLGHPWEMVIIDRTALLPNRETDRLTVQTVPPWIYEASYPAWFLSKAWLHSAFSNDYELIANWTNEDSYPIEGDVTSFEGFCFRRRKH